MPDLQPEPSRWSTNRRVVLTVLVLILILGAGLVCVGFLDRSSTPRSYASVSLERLEFVPSEFPRGGLDEDWTPFSVEAQDFCESPRLCEGVAHLDRFGSLPIVGYVWLRAERLSSPLESAEWGDKMMADSSYWGDGCMFRSYETEV